MRRTVTVLAAAALLCGCSHAHAPAVSAAQQDAEYVLQFRAAAPNTTSTDAQIAKLGRGFCAPNIIPSIVVSSSPNPVLSRVLVLDALTIYCPKRASLIDGP